MKKLNLYQEFTCPAKYTVKFVGWETSECWYEAFDEIFTLWFEIVETTPGLEDYIGCNTTLEIYGDYNSSDINSKFLQLLSTLSATELPDNSSFSVRNILRSAVGKNFSALIERAPRRGSIWEGISNLEKLT